MKTFLERRRSMQHKNVCDFSRLYHLLRNEVLTSYRSLLTAAGGIFGVIFFIFLLTSRSEYENFHTVWYVMLLFIGGYLFSSRAFREVHTAPRNYLYLTLPASQFEKLLSKLLITSVGYALVTMIVYFLFSVLVSITGQLFFGVAPALFNPFTARMVVTLGVYLVTQSLFLFASIYFRSRAIFKLLSALFGLALVLGLVTTGLMRVIFNAYFTSGCESFALQASDFAWVDYSIVGWFVKIAFWVLFAPYFWILSYLRLKETEV